MHNELSIEKGTLENTSETLRFIQNVRTQIGLRALTADFVVGQWQGWFNVWLDLKNDPSETAQKLLNTVLHNGAGYPLNDPKRFGKEISDLAEQIGDILMDMHIQMPRQSVCIYTTTQNLYWGMFTVIPQRSLAK